jgi:Two component regulator propeller
LETREIIGCDREVFARGEHSTSGGVRHVGRAPLPGSLLPLFGVIAPPIGVHCLRLTGSLLRPSSFSTERPIERVVRARFPFRVVLLNVVFATLALAEPDPHVRASAAVPQFVFHSYRQAEGLRNLTVTATARDSRGFLWVGTQNGLYRFLGSSFQEFGLAEGILEPAIEDLLAAPDGSLWVGTAKNLYRWTGERFVPAAPNPISIWRNGRILSEGPGDLLMVAGDRLSRLVYRPDGSLDSFVPVFSDAFESRNPDLKKLGSLAPSQAGLWLKTLSVEERRLERMGRNSRRTRGILLLASHRYPRLALGSDGTSRPGTAVRRHAVF